MSYKDLLGPEGDENNMGGTKQFLNYGRHSEVLTWGEPDPLDAATDDKYVIKTAHAMKVGKEMYRIYCTMDTSELEAALQGERDGKSNKLTMKFWHPGSKKAVIKFANEVKNDKTFWLVPLADGTIFQLGTADWVCDVMPSFKSNKNSGSKGYEFTVECMMPDVLLYEAAIPLTPAA